MRAWALLCLALGACQQGGTAQSVPGDSSDKRPFSAIAADEVLRFGGTEPFWGGEVSGSALTYTTPDNIEGETVVVERFAGRGGVAFSGTLDGAALDMMVTQGECSDGMSDRKFPFTVTLKLGALALNGCAWSDAHPFEETEIP